MKSPLSPLTDPEHFASGPLEYEGTGPVETAIREGRLHDIPGNEPTPETDALVASIKQKDQPDWLAAIRLEGKCKALERERDAAIDEIEAMLEAIRDTHDDLEMISVGDSSFQQRNEAVAALAKLRPFIKP